MGAQESSPPPGFARDTNGCSVVQVRLQTLLLDRGADILAVDKMSRCGTWLDRERLPEEDQKLEEIALYIPPTF